MNGHWTGWIGSNNNWNTLHCNTTIYHSENARLNTMFRVGLHSVHILVFRQSWFQSRRQSVETQALPPRAGNCRDTVMNYEVASPVLRHYYEKLSPVTSHGQVCPLEIKFKRSKFIKSQLWIVLSHSSLHHSFYSWTWRRSTARSPNRTACDRRLNHYQ